MPTDDIILSIPGYKVEKISGRNPLNIRVFCQDKVCCPFCRSSNLRKKSVFRRKVKHQGLGFRTVYLIIRGHKYHCQTCFRYFNQRFPGILPYKRATEQFRHQIFEMHKSGISQSRLASMMKVGAATIERWYHDFLKRKNAEIINSYCPKELGIDEHFFSKKKGYATTFCDLGNNKIFDIALGRSEKSLKRYLEALRGKENVKVINMDLSETYRRIAKTYFPQANIVADRFHVIRLINHHFLKTWQEIDPVGRKNRGLLSLMRRHHENLTKEQTIKLEVYFSKHPAIEAVYFFKQRLVRLLLIKTRTKKQCRTLATKLLYFINELKNSYFEYMIRLGETMDSWKDEIARMWRYTKTNSITEGFHRKMKLIQRIAYGFKNFENYRLRVRALCC